MEGLRGTALQQTMIALLKDTCQKLFVGVAIFLCFFLDTVLSFVCALFTNLLAAELSGTKSSLKKWQFIPLSTIFLIWQHHTFVNFFPFLPSATDTYMNIYWS